MADNLISMKRSAQDKRQDAGEPCSMEAMAPDYPWGLCLRMDKDELDKLGITDLPKVGAELMMTVKVKVTRVSQSAAEGADDQTSVEFQVTDMAKPAKA